MDSYTAYLMGVEYFEWGVNLIEAVELFAKHYPDDEAAFTISLIDGWDSAKAGNI